MTAEQLNLLANLSVETISKLVERIAEERKEGESDDQTLARLLKRNEAALRRAAYRRGFVAGLDYDPNGIKLRQVWE